MSSNIFETSAETRTADAHLSPILKKRLEKLRYVGFHGGTISQHRALLTLPMQGRKFFPAMLSALLLFALYLWALGWVNDSWHWILQTAIDAFNWDASINEFGFQVGALSVFAPYIQLAAHTPSGDEWTWGVILTAAVLIVSLVLPDRFLPLNYLLRALAFIQSCSLFYFAFFAHYFPYGLAGYHAVMMLAGLVFISLVPLIFGLIYFIFFVQLRKKLLLTALTMLHLGILIPLQYIAHVYLIQQFSLLYMPVLFLMFGLMIDVFVFIAFYAWGMSWEGTLQLRQETILPPSTVEKLAVESTADISASQASSS